MHASQLACSESAYLSFVPCINACAFARLLHSCTMLTIVQQLRSYIPKLPWWRPQTTPFSMPFPAANNSHIRVFTSRHTDFDVLLYATCNISFTCTKTLLTETLLENAALIGLLQMCQQPSCQVLRCAAGHPSALEAIEVTYSMLSEQRQNVKHRFYVESKKTCNAMCNNLYLKLSQKLKHNQTCCDDILADIDLW